jgi:class 3 adenylate cyclase
MHREFKKLLRYATGESGSVLAIFLDVRGFSEFSLTVDSADTAVYIKRLYAEILDKYFPRARYFKPTGDGLLIIEDYTERTLRSKVQATILSSFSLIEDFGGLTTADPMVNFDVPSRVGVGLSRGAACRLVSRGKTLDYSGRVLNLASRLMGLARPKGIVFDSALGPELLPSELLEKFVSETVFLKGIAEDTPVTVFHSQDVVIDDIARRPLSAVSWASVDRTYTLKELKGQLPVQAFILDQVPRDPKAIQVKVITRDPRGRNRGGLTWDLKGFEYRLDVGRPTVTVPHQAIPELVAQWGIRRNLEEVELRVLYPISRAA